MIKESDAKIGGGMRFAQIVLGAIAIIVSLYMLTYPGITTVTLVYILAILFFVIGIEKILTGIFFKSKSRLASIGLGILVLILAGIAIAYPLGTTALLIMIVAIALLFDGIARIVHGIGEKADTKINRFFSIAVGIISIAISGLIMMSPVFGLEFVGILIGISILITGIQILVAGLKGRKIGMISPSLNEDKTNNKSK